MSIVVDIGEDPRGLSPLILGKKMHKEEKLAGQANAPRPPP